MVSYKLLQRLGVSKDQLLLLVQLLTPMIIGRRRNSPFRLIQMTGEKED
ncbi:MAG: hypothetical protein ETSY1_23170 [Candidatus Entotheonella factor]|uniref:Uncharacterized protein n=1 Tax=Entotheonella factor TaxID=1429438 RepID=W4LHZ5_ENTF1|nr:MAG: hypothetical protein ETSY1_23170 [Candidatus Entotheonella factor]